METYKINEDMQIEEFSDNEIMFYNPADEGIHIFNQTAALILKLLREHNFSDAKDKFVSLFRNEELTEQILSDDFKQTVEDMVSKNILIKI